MIAIAVDDEPLLMSALVQAIQISPDVANAIGFCSCEAALDFAHTYRVDVAFLDIHMRGMSGLTLAEKLTELQPNCKIVFCTGFEEYAIPAFKIHASGYLLKPISAADVQAELDNIKGIRQREKLMTVKCFGNFEAYVNGQILPFKRTKTKELLAFLVDRRGAGVTAAEICAALWEDDNHRKNQNYIHQLFHDLRSALDATGAGAVFKRNTYLYCVDPEKIDCDYYDFLKTGEPPFLGEYMTQYSWAEETCGLLWENLQKEITE